MADKKEDNRDVFEKALEDNYDPIKHFAYGIPMGMAGAYLASKLRGKARSAAERKIFQREQEAISGGRPITRAEQRELSRASRNLVGREAVGMIGGSAAAAIPAGYPVEYLFEEKANKGRSQRKK